MNLLGAILDSGYSHRLACLAWSHDPPLVYIRPTSAACVCAHTSPEVAPGCSARDGREKVKKTPYHFNEHIPLNLLQSSRTYVLEL